MKTVVIASGKGGTGKTTITALFAHFATQSLSVTVCDTDVEASNLPLALQSEELSRKGFSGRSRAWINPDLCTACGECVRICRFSAIDLLGARYTVDNFACEGCERCLHVCPVGAINLTESCAGIICRGTGTTGSIAYGQLEPGEDLSGKLVTEIRGVAREAAEQDSSDLILVDGPPGIGCPVIAAVANADILVAVTEPTVSGEHDLARLVELAQRLGIPVVVLLNKFDLSPEGAERIRMFAHGHNLPLIAEIPFDPEIGQTLARLAASNLNDAIENECKSLHAVRGAWGAVSSLLMD